MANGNPNVTIEGFVTDLAFDDRTKNVNDVFASDVGQVAALTNRVLSYFTKPAIFSDKRNPSDRKVNWAAITSPKVVIDSTEFDTFVTVANGLSGSALTGFFKIIDRLIFNYSPTDTAPTTEAFLVGDSDIKSIYVPKSFAVSTTIVTDTVYLNNSTTPVSVPTVVDFKVKLPTGSTTTTFVLRLYVSVEAWIQSYSVSKVVKVIPPLPYQQLYESSIVNSNDNIFSTASLSAKLNFSTTQALIGVVPISGISEYKAVLTNGVDKKEIPFNILYRGRAPTLFQIRNAIKDALANSGVGNDAGWKARIPNVYVTGRFYIVPLWDQVYTKPGQKVYPSINRLSVYENLTTSILSSLGYGELGSYIDVLSVAYNRMTATAIPDLSGTINAQHLVALIPDYQDCATSDEQFNYMSDRAQQFSREINQILSVDSGVSNSQVYTPNKEGLLTFYAFTVDEYEFCVITKSCYTSLRG